MNILIVDCLTAGSGFRRFSRDFIGGGPKLIAGVLNQLEIKELSIVIYRVEELFSKLSQITDNLNKFDIGLISAMTMDMESVKKFTKLWRRNNKERILIIGGPIALDSTLLKKLDVDIIVHGEGEKKIKQIIKSIAENESTINNLILDDLNQIKGIKFRYDDKEFITESSPNLSLEDYNKFTNPKFIIRYVKHYKNYKGAKVYVECLRGCSNYYRSKFLLKNHEACIKSCRNCTEGDLKDRINCPVNIPPGCGFCSTISNFGYPKSRNIKDINNEIRALIKIGVKRIVLGGPDLLDFQREESVENGILSTPRYPPEPNYAALIELIHEIIEIPTVKEEKVQIFIENIKASLCTDRALDILSKIPNSIFSIGCETGADLFAKQLGRPTLPSEMISTIRRAVSLGIRVHVYFIHSLPGENIEHLKKSIALINDLYINGVEKITIYKYQEFPGSPFYILRAKEHLLKRNNKELNKFRKKLVRTAINFNKKRKEEMIGGKYDVILAEKNVSKERDVIGYIIKGGPKVLIKNASKHLGKVASIEIDHVISDKLVEGHIISKGLR